MTKEELTLERLGFQQKIRTLSAQLTLANGSLDICSKSWGECNAALDEAKSKLLAANQRAEMLADSVAQAGLTQADLDAAVQAERERCATICDTQKAAFLSPQYATNQPFSSFKERFACGVIAEQIRKGGNP